MLQKFANIIYSIFSSNENSHNNGLKLAKIDNILEKEHIKKVLDNEAILILHKGLFHYKTSQGGPINIKNINNVCEIIKNNKIRIKLTIKGLENLSLEEIEPLLIAINETKTFNSIKIVLNEKIKNAVLEEILRAINENSNITKLEISNSYLESETLKNFEEFKIINTTQDVDRNDIVMFSGAIKHFLIAAKNIKKFCISNILMSYETCADIAIGIKKNNSITKIDFHNFLNKSDNKEAGILLLEKLKKNNNIKNIKFSTDILYRLSSDFLKKLYEVLPELQITNLTVNNCYNHENNEASLLANGIRNNKTLESIDLPDFYFEEEIGLDAVLSAILMQKKIISAILPTKTEEQRKFLKEFNMQGVKKSLQKEAANKSDLKENKLGSHFL